MARAWKRLVQGATITTTLGGFCFGIARMVRLESFPEAAHCELPADLPAPESHGSHGLTARESAVYLQECLSLLPPDEASLLVRYYLEDRKALARELGKNENALRVEVFRIRRHLFALVEPEERVASDSPRDPA
jgi:DNA-directed RNA polymerase specialized sigma24 family protein